MRGLDRISPKGSAYFWGTVTGLVIAIPLTGAVFGAVAVATPSAVTIEAPVVQTVTPKAMLQSLAVNRATKSSALKVTALETRKSPAPAVDNSAGMSTTVKADEVKADALPVPVAPKARTMRTPKGCLSSIGVTKANIATEELTVCVADISVVRNIN